MRTHAKLAVLIGLAGLGSGCMSDEYRRADGLTDGAGNTMAANSVMQMVDPWQDGVAEHEAPGAGCARHSHGRRRRRCGRRQANRRQRAATEPHEARTWPLPAKTKRIVLVSTDKTFLQDTKAAFASSDLIQLATVEKNVIELRGEIQEADCDAVIIDMDAAKLEEIEALQRITRRLEGKAPILVVTQEFNAAAVRILVQLQVADFLVKPITTADLVRSCIRVLQGPGREENTESQIYTFMPAAGGVGTHDADACRPRSSCIIR